MRTLLICVLILFGAGVANAGTFTRFTGTGDPPQEMTGDILRDLNAPRIAEIERDVLRFSSAPPLGGRGYMMTFVGAADGAWAEVVWALWDNRVDRWRATRRERFELEPSEYEDLATFADQAYLRGARRGFMDPAPEAIYVCADGPGYLTERLIDGRQIWLAGPCGPEHPNDEIADYLVRWLADRLGGD